MMSWSSNIMILGGMVPLYESVRLHFNSIKGMVMERSSFLRETASSNKMLHTDLLKLPPKRRARR